MYYLVPSIMETGATKYLILMETDSAGLVVWTKFDDLTKARASLEKAKTIIDANPKLTKRKEQWDQLARTFSSE